MKPMVLPDGSAIILEDFHPHIENLILPWGSSLTLTLGHDEFGRDEQALVTSTLVVPWIKDVLTAEDDCGNIEIVYNTWTMFFAPAVALANRYYALTRTNAAMQRAMVGGRCYEIPWNQDVFASPFVQIINIREGLTFEVKHVLTPGVRVRMPESFLVEVQMLVKLRRPPPWTAPRVP